MAVSNNPFEINSTGIMERKNGTFRARVSFTNPVTKEKTVFDRSYPTALEAYEARKTFLEEMARVGRCALYKDYKFDDVFWEHLENCDYKPATIRRKKSLYKQHIKDVFGNRCINRITAGELDDFLIKLGKPTLDKKFGKPKVYSQEYVAGFYKLFTALFSYAYEHEYVDRDVTKQMSKRKPWYRQAKSKEEGRYLSPEELAVIGEELKGTNLYTSFMIAIHTGLRKSEIFGLLWDDVDFENNVLRVSKQLLKNEEYKIWDLVSLKTDNSERIVPIPQELVSYLKALREEQKAQRRKLGKYYRKKPVGYIDRNGAYNTTTEFELVNVKPTGEHLNSDSTTYATRKFEKTTGKYRFLLDPNDPKSSIDFSYHDFRHTYATLCAQKGVAVEDLQDILGHKKISTTKEFYLHKDTINNPIRDEHINRIFNELNSDIKEISRVKEQEAKSNSTAVDEGEEKSQISSEVSSKPIGYFQNGVFIAK